MNYCLKNILILGLLVFPALGFSQISDETPKEVIYKFENSGFLEFHSNGWGIGYRTGKFTNGYKKKTYDFSFSSVTDLKQIKQSTSYTMTGSRFIYGKTLNFYNIKALIGTQKVITTKPYWGGVEFRKFLFGGINLGIGKPVYLYIYNYIDGNIVSLEKFDPDKYDFQDIYAKGPFSKGLDELKFYPGLSLKTGINVEYGIETEKAKSVEIGGIIDVYPIPVQIMAYENPKYAMFAIYLSFHFGKRYNK
ncbi:MAG: hypothetical protein AUJ98_08140 [Bacteroidetes bacterium CG2_30_33_31]|nr:MAG: hypothetical protein AUJ98_08140 [Bacteroidetes bacterium CG2_30_33_31]